MAKPIVAIIGRPNVGKSTLFNRLVGGRLAIVENVPGVTRDRLYRDVEWCGRVFTLIDTGGFQDGEKDIITTGVKLQIETAIQEADLILFLVDTRQGLVSDDQLLADSVRKFRKAVILVANKVENFQDPGVVYDFYRLGLGTPLPVSASHGLNTGDLLDSIISYLPEPEEIEKEGASIQVAVVGRPNVGKSSLVNYLLGKDRVIVSENPGTTRDAIDTVFNHDGDWYVLIDTAGMRRKSRIEVATEYYSVKRALWAVDRCDVALLVVDAVEGITAQDKKIAGYIHEAGKGVVLVVNKYDLIIKDNQTMKQYREQLQQELSFMTYAPGVFVSALTGLRVRQILELVKQVFNNAEKRIPTTAFNDLLQEVTALNPPPQRHKRQLKIYYGTQVGIKPPTFALFVNSPELLHFSYRRYLENQIRQVCDYTGTSIRFLIRRRSNNH